MYLSKCPLAGIANVPVTQKPAIPAASIPQRKVLPKTLAKECLNGTAGEKDMREPILCGETRKRKCLRYQHLRGLTGHVFER